MRAVALAAVLLFVAGAGTLAAEPGESRWPELRFGLDSSITSYAVDTGTPFGPFLAVALTDTAETVLKLSTEGIAGPSAGFSYRLAVEAKLRAGEVRVKELSGAALTPTGLVEGGIREISQGKGFSVHPNCPFDSDVSYYLLQATGSPVGDWALLGRVATREPATPPVYMLQLSRAFVSADLELAASGGRDLPVRIGAGWSSDLGHGWQAYADVAARPPDYGREYRLEALTGLQYTNEAGTVTTAELFHTGLGYDAAERALFWQVARNPATAGGALATMQQVRLGQTYAALALTHPGVLGGAGWEVSLWVNLADGSQVWKGHLSGSGDGLVPVLEVERFGGAALSEFGSQARTKVKLGFDGYF